MKVLSNYLHLQAHCDKLKAFRIAQFFQNSKIQKITVKKFFFRNSDDGFLLIGVFWVYIRSFKAKLAETKIWIFSESNPTAMKSTPRSSRRGFNSFCMPKKHMATIFPKWITLSSQRCWSYWRLIYGLCFGQSCLYVLRGWVVFSCLQKCAQCWTWSLAFHVNTFWAN